MPESKLMIAKGKINTGKESFTGQVKLNEQFYADMHLYHTSHTTLEQKKEKQKKNPHRKIEKPKNVHSCSLRKRKKETKKNCSNIVSCSAVSSLIA